MRNNDGSIDRSETSNNTAYGRTPMSEASFNELYRNVNNKWSQSAKLSAARDAFNTGTYYFSTAQVREIVELLTGEAHRLELLKLAYDNVSDNSNFYSLYSLLRSQASQNELDNYVRNSGFDNTSTSNNSKVAMTSAAFNKVYQEVSYESGTSRRLSAATRAFNTSTNYFNVAQARQLISLVTGENNRLQLAKLSLDNIADQENITQLFDLLTTQAAKQELDEYIRTNGDASGNYNYTIRVAMTDTEFNSLINTIRKKWLPLSKYSAATDAFNSTTNYFTTAQARQVIALLSSESNRLELAKLAFDNIVDQQNFRQLYDLFATQASKDALDEHIRSNHNYQL